MSIQISYTDGTDAEITHIARSIARADYDDAGMYLDAIHDAVRAEALARGVVGSWDDESLTWISEVAS